MPSREGKRSPGAKERAWITVVLSVAYALVLVFMTLLFAFLYNSQKLSLDNLIEKTFNRVLIATADRESDQSVENMMRANGIYAFGVFSPSGVPYLYYGPEIEGNLDMHHFSKTNVPFYKTSNVIGYDYTKNIVECIRVISLNMVKDLDIKPIDDILSQHNEVIYFAIYAVEFFNSMVMILIGYIICILVATAAYVFLLIFYQRNVLYREKLREQESLVAMGQAARTLTHEIKNPLSAITLQVALLKRLAPSDLQDDLKVVESEAKRLTMLTNRVSEYLRNPEGEPEVLSLQDAVKALEGKYPSDIVWDIESAGEAEIEFDEERLRSVITNLIDNAVEASPNNTKEIKISLKKKGSTYVLTISDRGKGIKAEDFREIFNPFYTTKTHGAGIGIPISMQFMRAAGGTLEIKSKEGEGTTVTLTFRQAKQNTKGKEKGNEGSNL